MVFKELPISVNSWRQHKNVFSPLFFQQGDWSMPIWPAFKQSPLEAPPVVKLSDPPTLHCRRHQPQPRTTPHIYSGKLVYAAEWMRKSKYFSGKRKQKKGQGRSHLWKAEGGSHMMKKMGTGLRSGTARFLTGSLPSAPWEVRSSALQTHEGHHLLQLKGQPLFPGCIVLLQWTHNLLSVFSHVGVNLTERAHGVELIHVHPWLFCQVGIHVLVTDRWHLANVWVVPLHPALVAGDVLGIKQLVGGWVFPKAVFWGGAGVHESLGHHRQTGICDAALMDVEHKLGVLDHIHPETQR